MFDELTRIDLPERTPVLFDTACVLGGSIAGLLAAPVAWAATGRARADRALAAGLHT
jgi:hypothetical protein